MINSEVRFCIKAKDAHNKHEEQHLERLSCADKASEKVLSKLKGSQYDHQCDRNKHEVIVVIDLKH